MSKKSKKKHVKKERNKSEKTNYATEKKRRTEKKTATEKEKKLLRKKKKKRKTKTLQCATVKNPRVLEFFNIYINIGLVFNFIIIYFCYYIIK